MSAASQSRMAEILLVEDNPADVRLTREAFADARVLNHLRVAKDGVEALAILRQEGDYLNEIRPDLILLDLNLPKKDGRDVLAEIKSDPRLRRIPVVVLTTSRAEADILRSYDLHANAYVAKPLGFQDFLAAVRSVERFWLTIAALPHASEEGV